MSREDRVFAIYALGMIGTVGTLLTSAVFFGIASAPPVDFVVEHVALGLVVRTSYKSLSGITPMRDFLAYTGMITSSLETDDPGSVPAAA